jgi:dipeptidyl aminopeptidase/acylaminoacyl peptidase
MIRLSRLAVLIALAPAVIGAQEKPSDTLLTVGHYFDLESVRDPQISPDGSNIVYTRRWVNTVDDHFESALWIMRADGSHNRVFAKGSNPQWSPDGTRIAYLADSDPTGAQIYVRWIDGDAGSTQLTHVTTSPADIRWSPDGRSISFSMFVGKPNSWPIDMPPPPDGAHWTAAPRIVQTLHFKEDGLGFQEPGFQQLFVVSVDGGPARQITKDDWDVGSRFDNLPTGVAWDWLPDGRTIVFEGLIGANGDDRLHECALYALDLATGTVRPLTAPHGEWTRPVVSPDGKHIAYVGYPDDQTHDRAHETTNLYVMDVDGTHARPVAPSLDREVSQPVWSPDNTSLVFTAEDHGTAQLFSVSLTTGTVRPITSGPIVVGLGSVSRTGMAAVTRATIEHPAEVARVEIGGKGALVPLTHINDATLARIHLGTVEPVTYPSTGGVRVEGWILKPPGFDPSKHYPMILAIHGGPQAMANVGFNYAFQNFAANGYVVLFLNPRGSTGYGTAFMQAIDRAFPGVDYDDLMAGVDTVVARGYVDAKRLYVTGCSSGGLLAAWTIGHTTRFAAAAIDCPVTDFISMAGESDTPLYAHSWFDKPFWDDPSAWLEKSPIMYVGHVTTPTLIMTGELDRRTPMPQSEELYVALKMRHVPTTLLRFVGEFHGTGRVKPTNFARTQLYTMSWFKKFGGWRRRVAGRWRGPGDEEMMPTEWDLRPRGICRSGS